jgi:uncharacterized membrane protein YfcA
MTTTALIIYAIASFLAGITNTLAGGGSFMTFPALLLTGLDARAANITSTIALFPMQIVSGFAGRKLAGDAPQLTFKALCIISVIGGTIGAILLLTTPPEFFARLVPWLILFATGVFAYGSFRKKPTDTDPRHHMGKTGNALCQLGIAIYGGYFGAGIGFLMLAALTLSGMSIQKAGNTKNILAAIINAAAVLIFLFSKNIGWTQLAVGAVLSILGGLVGVRLLNRINERILRIIVIGLGATMTVLLFLKS